MAMLQSRAGVVASLKFQGAYFSLHALPVYDGSRFQYAELT